MRLNNAMFLVPMAFKNRFVSPAIYSKPGGLSNAG